MSILPVRSDNRRLFWQKILSRLRKKKPAATAALKVITLRHAKVSISYKRISVDLEPQSMDRLSAQHKVEKYIIYEEYSEYEITKNTIGEIRKT